MYGRYRGGRFWVAVAKQVDVVETVTGRGGFGAIVLATVDSLGPGSANRKAKEVGVHVFLADSGDEGCGDSLNVIQTGNLPVADAGAHYVASLIVEADWVMMLECERGGGVAASRTKGFRSGIAAFPVIAFVTSIAGHWALRGGVEAAQALISGHTTLI